MHMKVDPGSNLGYVKHPGVTGGGGSGMRT